MSWGLSRIFKRGAANPKALPNHNRSSAAARGRADPEALFSTAHYGDQCRSRAFSHLDGLEGQEIWRKALYNGATSGWQLIDIEKLVQGPEGDGPVYKTKPVKDGLSFFAAIKDLAEYEHSQSELGLIPVGADPDALGLEHYRAFAEREGIIFDTENYPHPTVNGEIVTAGNFTAAAIENARAHRRVDKPYQYLGRDLLTAMVGDQTVPKDLAEQILFKAVHRQELLLIHKRLDTLRKIMVCCFARNIWTDDYDYNILETNGRIYYEARRHARLYGHSIKDQEAFNILSPILRGSHDLLGRNQNKETPLTAAAKLIESCHSHIENLPAAAADKQQITRIVLYLETMFRLMCARYRQNRLEKQPDNAAQLVKQIRQDLNAAAALGKEAGADPDIMQHMRGYIFADEKIIIPPELDEMIDQIGNICAIVDQDLQRDRGQARNALPPPAMR